MLYPSKRIFHQTVYYIFLITEYILHEMFAFYDAVPDYLYISLLYQSVSARKKKPHNLPAN